MGKKRTVALACCLSAVLVCNAGCSPTGVEPAGTPTPSNPSTPTASPTETPEVIEIDDPADVIFQHGTVMTMEAGYPVVEAIAIRGDRILAVGNDDEILGLQGPETVLINLHGQTLLPGFTDSHSHILWVPPDRTLDEVQDLALSYGYTSLIERTSDEGHLARLLQAEADDRLRLRVNVFPNYNSSRLDEYGNMMLTQYWYPENDPILDSERMLRIPGIKIFVDGAGIPGRGCPAMREPYSEISTSADWFQQSCGSEYGDLYWPDQAELNRVVAAAQDAGYRVAFHAMGDRAIETALDAIAFALGGKPNSIFRHQILHNSFLEPDLLHRYPSEDILAEVGGVFNTCDQDFYTTLFEPYPYEWAANRWELPGLGVHTCLGTDFRWVGDPIDVSRTSPLNPMVQLWGLVTHQQLRPDGTTCLPDPWIAQHVIAVDQALRMMTYEPAYAVSQEDVLGTLEPGKFADLIVLSHNPLTVDPNDLKDIEVWMTMVGGHVAYCARGRSALCPRLHSEQDLRTDFSPAQGNWTAIDIDGSSMRMQVIQNTDGTFSIHAVDENASYYRRELLSIGPIKFEWEGRGTAEGYTLHLHGITGLCIGTEVELVFDCDSTYDPDADTLLDSVFVEWYRR